MNRRLIFAVLALLCAGAVSAQERTEAPAASSEVRYVGRTQTNGGDVSFDWSGTCFECRFTGGSLAMRVSDTKKNYYNLTVDGRDAGVVTTFGTDSVVVLAEKLGRGEHTVRMQKRTEGEQGRTTIHAFLLDRGRRLLPAAPAPGRHIEFIGNSLTCGYGTEGLSKDEPFKPQTENCNKAYACIIADATACCAEGMEFVLEGDYTYPDDYPELGAEITVIGEFQSYEENGMTWYHLVNARLA